MASPDERRRIPRTDVVLADPRLLVALERLGPAEVKRAVVAAQSRARTGEVAAQEIADVALADLAGGVSSLRRVVNATGVVLHTNLGRAELSTSATEAIVEAAGYVDVEFDLATGRRAARGAAAVRALLQQVPDAESALIVNNGAAALLLATATLATTAGSADPGEVVISRGEMVEIGDGFRLPDLIASTGVRIREVGTTNRVRLDDYAAAIGPGTGCIVKIHPSNFRVQGFTSVVSVAELATLGRPVIVDVGSGLLSRSATLADEPDMASALRSGAAIVTASGDKLLGGPQAGLVVGQRDPVERMRRHPMARALRVDKLTLAALEATLRGPAPPTHRYLFADPDDLRTRVKAVVDQIAPTVADVRCEASDGAVGGGGAPGVALPGWAVSLPPAFAEFLRRGDPPVVGRVERGRCRLDLRCVAPGEDGLVVAAVLAVARALG